MDTRRSFYLASREDDFAEPAADASRLDFSDIPFIMPANDNLRTKIAGRPAVGVCFVVCLPCMAFLARPNHEQRRSIFLPSRSRELIVKLIKAGYLRPALRHDGMPSRPQSLD